MRRAAIICFTLFAASCARTQQLSESPDVLIEALVAEGDERAPKHAIAAYEKLKNMGVKAFPELVKNANDQRYAWRCFQHSTLDRTTVGHVCFGIVQVQVEGRSLKLLYHWSSLWGEPLADWWSRRSGRTLRELQIEAARLALQRLAIAKDQGDRPSGQDRLLEYWTSRLQSLEAGREGRE